MSEKAETPALTERTLRGAALGESNGRLMAAYSFYDLSCNPHRRGSKAHAAFVEAFNKARSE